MNRRSPRWSPGAGSATVARFAALFPSDRCACGCPPWEHELVGNDVVCKAHGTCSTLFGAGEFNLRLREWAALRKGKALS